MHRLLAFRPMASDQLKPAAFLGVAFENGVREPGDYENELGAVHHDLGSVDSPARRCPRLALHLSLDEDTYNNQNSKQQLKHS